MAETITFTQLKTRIAEFGAELAAADCTAASGNQLHSLVATVGGLESQVAVFRSHLLTLIDQLGGDPIDTQKRAGKSSHSASKRNATTAKALNELPSVKEKMAQGNGMSPGKASLLAGAAKKTSSEAVDGDTTLIDKIEGQDEDRAKKTIDKWVRDRQSNGDRKTQRQKNIDARQLAMFLANGMIHTHGQLPTTPNNMTLLRQFETEKTRLWNLDGGRESAHKSIRSDEQRGADAYRNVIDNIDGIAGGLRDRADWCNNVDHQPAPDPPTTEPTPDSPGDTKNPGFSKPALTSLFPTPEDDADDPAVDPNHAPTAATLEPQRHARTNPKGFPPPPAPPPPPPRSGDEPACDCKRKTPTRSQIVVVATAENITGDNPEHLAEIIGGGPLLTTELERLKCNAEIYGMLFDPTGQQPLWAGRAIRGCTDAQWRALLIRDEGCVLTGADPTHCEAHHLLPYEAPAKGRTDITNLALVSVAVHHWLHDNKLTLYQEPDGTWETRPALPHEIAPRGRKSKAA